MKQTVRLGVPSNKAQSSLSSQGGASGLEPARRKGKPSHVLPVAAGLRGRGRAAEVVFPLCGINPAPKHNNHASLFNFT